jgi:hypothetical protein
MSAHQQFGQFLIANHAFSRKPKPVLVLVELISVNRANEFDASARNIPKPQNPAPNANRISKRLGISGRNLMKPDIQHKRTNPADLAMPSLR